MRRPLARNTNSIGGVDQNLKDELSRVFVVGQTHGCDGRPQIITRTYDRVPLQDPVTVQLSNPPAARLSSPPVEP
jgi:hypothetical protein